MNGPRVLLIGGTSDSRALARALRAEGIGVLVSTLTDHGAELATDDATEVRSGALGEHGMAELAAGGLAIVDASHPFAREATRAARAAARSAGIPYLRLERPAVESADAIVCDSAEEAARVAVEAAGGGTVFLTVGSRTLATYTAECREAGVRCVARVLPVPEALSACAEAGLTPADIVAMQGPASVALDAALMRQLDATVLVTKDSGVAGGLPKKLEAARLVGATAVVVARPEDDDPTPPSDRSASVAELVDRVVELAGIPERAAPEAAGDPSADAARGTGDSSSEPARRPDEPGGPVTGLVHVYTGDGKGKTTASVGLAVRAAGAGLRVAFVQFVKGGAESSELESLRRLGVVVTRPAKRSSGLMRNTVTAEDRSAADLALEAARSALGGTYDVVVLDEACVAARSGLVEAEALASAIAARPEGIEVVMTGRGVPEALLAIADYVTEMRPDKHPYERGVPARKGVEF